MTALEGGGYLDLAGKQGDGYITDPDHPACLGDSPHRK
eukprot:COSAG01_NODE_79404_length_131_cov_368.500000_1_plen_37_part_10